MSRRHVALVAALAIAPLLLADAPAAANPDPAPPAYGELPAGTISEPPTKKTPWGIGGGERAAGFVVSRPSDYTMVSASKADVNGSPPPGGALTCFSQPMQLGFAADGELAAQEWAQPQPVVNLASAAELGGRNGVTALHWERVVPVDATHASLEWADAWVDPTTRGSRLIGKGSMALRLVRDLPGGGKVLAARDGEHVQVVVVESSSKKQSFGARDQLLTLSARGAASASGCHHVRVALHTEKGSSDNASIFATAQLPALPDAAPQDTLKGKNLMTIRVRPLAVAASVTWTSRDAEPVVAIAVGWRAREQNVQAIDNTAGF